MAHTKKSLTIYDPFKLSLKLNRTKTYLKLQESIELAKPCFLPLAVWFCCMEGTLKAFCAHINPPTMAPIMSPVITSCPVRYRPGTLGSSGRKRRKNCFWLKALQIMTLERPTV